MCRRALHASSGFLCTPRAGFADFSHVCLQKRRSSLTPARKAVQFTLGLGGRLPLVVRYEPLFSDLEIVELAVANAECAFWQSGSSLHPELH